MFAVDNYLQENSFSYDKANNTHYIGNRTNELLHLQEIVECCRYNHEKMVCNLEDFYQEEVEPGVYLCDWLFTDMGTDNHDERELLLRMSDMFTEYQASGDGIISIALGSFPNSCCTKEEYFVQRRDFLIKMKRVEEYAEFMPSCFQNSVFADNIIGAMKKIPDFQMYTAEITFNLSLLNDHAISIYEKNANDGIEAMKELSAHALECTGDPNHKEFLKFPFTYEIKTSSGETQKLIEEIACSPHMKLIQRNSDLRIYFYWYNEKIEEGKKVLIGRIGSHPY